MRVFGAIVGDPWSSGRGVFGSLPGRPGESVYGIPRRFFCDRQEYRIDNTDDVTWYTIRPLVPTDIRRMAMTRVTWDSLLAHVLARELVFAGAPKYRCELRSQRSSRNRFRINPGGSFSISGGM